VIVHEQNQKTHFLIFALRKFQDGIIQRFFGKQLANPTIPNTPKPQHRSSKPYESILIYGRISGVPDVPYFRGASVRGVGRS